MFLAVAMYVTESGETPALKRFVDSIIMPTPMNASAAGNKFQMRETNFSFLDWIVGNF
jgi:hypothetical protein